MSLRRRLSLLFLISVISVASSFANEDVSLRGPGTVTNIDWALSLPQYPLCIESGDDCYLFTVGDTLTHTVVGSDPRNDVVPNVYFNSSDLSSSGTTIYNTCSVGPGPLSAIPGIHFFRCGPHSSMRGVILIDQGNTTNCSLFDPEDATCGAGRKLVPTNVYKAGGICNNGVVEFRSGSIAPRNALNIGDTIVQGDALDMTGTPVLKMRHKSANKAPRFRMSNQLTGAPALQLEVMQAVANDSNAFPQEYAIIGTGGTNEFSDINVTCPDCTECRVPSVLYINGTVTVVNYTLCDDGGDSSEEDGDVASILSAAILDVLARWW